MHCNTSIDASAGDQILYDAPGIITSGSPIINKIELAKMPGASLNVIGRDARTMHGQKNCLFSNLKTGGGAEEIIPLREAQDRLLEAA
jgi:urease accessory protein